MRKFFYAKLALINIKKNRKTYFPYILTCIGTIVMYYILHFISVNEGLDQMSGGASLKNLLGFGTYVIAIFSVIFLFYTNSFLIKRRKKEFGLYNILGMEKKHIARMMVWETFFVSFISLIGGLITGILASKLMFLLLLNLLHFNVPFGYFISVDSMIATVILFAIIFLLTLLNNLRQIHLAKPIELIKGGQTGEKEPKTKWILTIIGILSLAGGYYISLTTESPLNALNLFFLAVVLVIIGTYALFIAGTVALLKMLRKKKKFYYKTKHFISVSGMIYRMKQNAAGLASICVLSTAVLVMLSTTVALYFGIEDVFQTRFPRDIAVTAQNTSEEVTKKIETIVLEEAENHEIKVEDTLQYRYTTYTTIQDKHVFSGGEFSSLSAEKIAVLLVMPLSEYNKLENKSVHLAENEVLLFTHKGEIKQNTIDIAGNVFNIKKRLDNLTIDESVSLVNTYSIVVPDLQAIEKINHTIYEDSKKMNNLSYNYSFDTDGTPEDKIALTNAIQGKLKALSIDGMVEGLEKSKDSFYSLYGGLFFLGIFLGALFIMATVLIIYYKQISEGFDDKHRFEIMQKVGLSKAEVKKAIHSQVLIIFFLPLVTAVIHIAFAFTVITKLLALLNLTNDTLFAFTTGGTILIFAIFYSIVYSLTAREYYKIVS